VACLLALAGVRCICVLLFRLCFVGSFPPDFSVYSLVSAPFRFCNHLHPTAGTPGSVPGRTIRSCIRCSSVHLSVQHASVFCFSRPSHWSRGCPNPCSAHRFRAVAGVSPIGRLLRIRSCVRIAVQASPVCLARPVRSSRAWKRAILPFSH
jgi:hypothetical protein